MVELKQLALVNLRQLIYFGKGQMQGWSYGQGLVKSRQVTARGKQVKLPISRLGTSMRSQWSFFRLYLNYVGCCRTLPNVAGRSRLDRASTSGLARYTVMEKVLTSGRIVQGVLNDYPKTENSQQPTAEYN